MNATLRKRLERLEAMLPAELPPREWTEEDRLRGHTLQELMGRMDPAHAHHIFLDLIERGGQSNLTRAALWIVDRNLTEGTPLELPGCAAEVYLQNPDAQPTHRCSQCGFLSPFTWGSLFTQPPGQMVSYLETCPLCGGSITWPSQFRHHRMHG